MSAAAAETRVTIQAGLPFRRAIRRVLQERDLRFVEDRGWLNSQFVVYGTEMQLLPLTMALRSVGAEIE